MSNNSILKSGSTGKIGSYDMKLDNSFKTLSRIIDTKLDKNITSDISLNNNRITNVKEPVNDNDVATKGYCDSLDMNTNRLINDCITKDYFERKLKLGNRKLDMNGHGITDVKLPLDSNDVTNKLYVQINGLIDDTLAEKLCKIGEIISLMLMKNDLQDKYNSRQFLNSLTYAISMYNIYKNTFAGNMEEINECVIFVDLKVNIIKLIVLLPKEIFIELKGDLLKENVILSPEKGIRKRYRRFLNKTSKEVDPDNTNEELQLLLYKNLLILDLGFVYLIDSLLHILLKQ